MNVKGDIREMFKANSNKIVKKASKELVEEDLKSLIDENKSDPECLYCKGKGWVEVEQKDEAIIQWFLIGKKPCICLFVKARKLRKVINEELKETVSQILGRGE